MKGLTLLLHNRFSRHSLKGIISPPKSESSKEAKFYIRIRSHLIFSRSDTKFIINVCLKGIITSVTRKHTQLSQSKNFFFFFFFFTAVEYTCMSHYKEIFLKWVYLHVAVRGLSTSCCKHYADSNLSKGSLTYSHNGLAYLYVTYFILSRNDCLAGNIGCCYSTKDIVLISTIIVSLSIKLYGEVLLQVKVVFHIANCKGNVIFI